MNFNCCFALGVDKMRPCLFVPIFRRFPVDNRRGRQADIGAARVKHSVQIFVGFTDMENRYGIKATLAHVEEVFPSEARRFRWIFRQDHIEIGVGFDPFSVVEQEAAVFL
jgi:hypothetical protein